MPRITNLLKIEGKIGVLLDMPEDDQGSIALFTDDELRKRDNDLIEACAKEADDDDRVIDGHLIAAAIRSLKGAAS